MMLGQAIQWCLVSQSNGDWSGNPAEEEQGIIPRAIAHLFGGIAERKQRAQERLEAVIQYVTTDHICRSRQLLSYFGETKSTPCGSCDVCLARKKRMRQEQEDEIRKAIRDLYQQDVTLREILDRLAGRYAEDDLLETMRQMVEDGDLLH